jgi:hypothetical protein
MSSINNNNNDPTKEGAMKEYTFMGGNRQPIIVQYNEDGKVLKIVKIYADPKWNREYINPKLCWAPGKESVNYMTEEFIQFVPEEWELYMAIQGWATLHYLSDDGYATTVYSMNAPICKQCGIFPVFEYRGFNQNGAEFTQGCSKKCTGCDETRRNESDGIATGDDVSIVYHPTIEDMTDSILGVIRQIIADDDGEDWDKDINEEDK